MADGTDFDPAAVVTREFLAQCLPSYLDRPSVEIRELSITRERLGTSAARHFAVSALTDACPEPLSFLLKVNRSGNASEACFYSRLAAKVPLSTPNVLAVDTESDRTWVLMERIEARDPRQWTDEDYAAVVKDIARLHASFWRSTDGIREPWLDEITPERVGIIASETIHYIDLIGASWLIRAAPEVFSGAWLDRMKEALNALDAIVEPLWRAGLTLVHGDVWFYNALLTRDGRRVFVDRQAPMIWGGFWELAHFINLLMAMGDAGYRQLPVAEDRIVRCVSRRAGEGRHRLCRRRIRGCVSRGTVDTPASPLAPPTGRSLRKPFV